MSKLHELKTVNWEWFRTGMGSQESLIYVDPDDVASVEPYVIPSTPKSVLPPALKDDVDNPRSEQVRRMCWSAITLKNGHTIHVAMRTDLIYEALATSTDRTHAPGAIHSLHCGVCNAIRAQHPTCPRCGASNSIWYCLREDGRRAFHCVICKRDISGSEFAQATRPSG